MSASSLNQLETRELTSKTRKEKGRKSKKRKGREGRGGERRRGEETASLVHNAMPETVEASIPEQSSQAVSIDKRI